MDYLFLHSEITGASWSAIFCCLGLAWVMPRGRRHFLLLVRFGR
jgi:hypothetical protein